MNGNIGRTGLVIVFAAALFATMAVTAQAEGPACSLARAAGNYGFTDNGMVVGVGPRVAVGIWTMDAAGKIDGKATSSLNGSIAEEAFSGTYTVNADCTGTTTVEIFNQSGNLLLTVKGDLAWDDNMREVRLIFTSAVLPDGTSLLTVISGDARKTVP